MYALECPLGISDNTRQNAGMRQRRRMIRLSRAQGHRRGPTRPCTHTTYTLLFVVLDVKFRGYFQQAFNRPSTKSSSCIPEKQSITNRIAACGHAATGRLHPTYCCGYGSWEKLPCSGSSLAKPLTVPDSHYFGQCNLAEERATGPFRAVQSR